MDYKLRIGPGIIIITALFALIVHYYQPIFGSILGENAFINSIGGKLYFIPIALSAIYWGLSGALAASMAFSILALLNLIFQPIFESALYTSIGEVVCFFLTGFIVSAMIPVDEQEDVVQEKPVEVKTDENHIDAMERLAKTVAKDVKQPLDSIRELLSKLKNETGPENLQPAIKSITKEVDRLNGVVADYIDFAAPRVTHTQHINVPAIIENVVEQVRPQAERVGVRLVLDSEKIEGFTHGDEERLNRMLLNLLINGLQASEGGGQVEVTCKRGGTKNIKIDISDTGAGIDQDNISKIFNPFFTTRQRGSGLGLSIAKVIAEEHNGSLEVYNLPSSGARFSISLPLTTKTIIADE